MTPSKLKSLYLDHCYKTGKSDHFFDRSSMAFFGDTMANYGVYPALLAYADGSDPIPGYVLYRKRPVKHGVQSDAYFTLEGEHTMRKPIGESSHE